MRTLCEGIRSTSIARPGRASVEKERGLSGQRPVPLTNLQQVLLDFVIACVLGEKLDRGLLLESVPGRVHQHRGRSRYEKTFGGTEELIQVVCYCLGRVALC